MKLPGFATREGTDRYRRRFDGKIPREHFRSMNGLWTSSIGIGGQVAEEVHQVVLDE